MYVPILKKERCSITKNAKIRRIRVVMRLLLSLHRFVYYYNIIPWAREKLLTKSSGKKTRVRLYTIYTHRDVLMNIRILIYIRYVNDALQYVTDTRRHNNR